MRDRKNARKRWRQSERGRFLNRLHHWKEKGIVCTEQQYTALLAKQIRRCAICRRHESTIGRAFDVDHDHMTGKIRGLVCNDCNRLVIKVVECYSRLLPVAELYLSRHR